LDLVAEQSLIASVDDGSLGRAIAYSTRSNRIPKDKIQLLDRHPVKLLAPLSREYYVGAKKHALDRFTARTLESGEFDLLHTWSGDAIQSLRTAQRLGVPSVLEIPTWHRNKGRVKKDKTWSEIQRDAAGFPKNLLNRLLITRQQVMEEYALADVILVLSERARETFLIAGVPESKLFMTSRGVDVERFTPGSRPENFRAIFVGALIKRKGVHHLLDVWKRLALPNAELVLVGQPSKELEPWLRDLPSNVHLRGQVSDVAAELRQASVHVFPSECEGSAKAIYEAAACGLAQITTRESGDVVQDSLNGLIIPPNDADALADAIAHLYSRPDEVERMGDAGRQRVVNAFTWDHFRGRLRLAYDQALRAGAGGIR
jgi:glycosyltransferase involved in cell wall biosynthesis